MAYDQAGKARKLQLQELEELCLEAYENSWIYKQKAKQFHDRQILRKEFQVSQKVLLFNSRLKLFAGKLRFRWDGPFVITNVFPYGEVELKDEVTNITFQVNEHQLKNFHEVPTPTVGESRSTLGSFFWGRADSAYYKPKSQKTIINLNLRGQRSFGIVLGIGLA
ncbi:hypothetical protein CR513_44743, partial [Mucuna pruriens]